MAIKFREGDTVTLSAVVRYNFDPAEDEHVALDVPGSISSNLWAKPEAVIIARQVIVIGDRVKFIVPAGPSGSEKWISGLVLAISNDHAWIDLGGGEYATRLLSSIQRDEES